MATYDARTLGIGGTPGVAPKDDPSTPSGDYGAMCDDWRLIHDILAGPDRIKNAGDKYLPRYQGEGVSDYKLRLAAAPWRPEFTDALRSLSSKPFTKQVKVNADAPDVIQGKVVNEKREGGIVDNIDGEGNSLHVFARDTFGNGVAYGLDAIYVTYPADEPAGPTKADEEKIGSRPYWVHIRAENILSVLWKKIGARKVVSHIRWRECEFERDGFDEIEVKRIRLLELDDAGRPTWKTFTKQKDGKYASDGDAQLLRGVTDIPVVLYFTGERSGNYRVKPPLSDLANMQIELYRSLSRKDQLLTLTSPMLVMVGVPPPEPTKIILNGVQTAELPVPQQTVGPGTIIYAYWEQGRDGVQPDAKYIEPAAANIDALEKNCSNVMEDFRRLAMQPTTPKSGNMVATGQAIEAAKAHSAVEAWANGLVDALNQAFMFTMQWLKLPDTVTAVVHTDFGVDVQGTEEAKVIRDAPFLSDQTKREEFARRGILGPNFDEDEEEQRIAGDQANNTLVPEELTDVRTGLPIKAMPGAKPGQKLPPVKASPGVPPVKTPATVN